MNEKNTAEASANKFEAIGRELEETINTLVDENCKLKNTIGQQEGKLE
jgi:hypothetical protein